MEDFIAGLSWDSTKNFVHDGVVLMPTIVKERSGKILGLVYSSRESLTEAMTKKTGVYHSRERGIWTKSPFRVNGQVLLRVETDCDRDALVFTVRQYGNFCHLERKTCFDRAFDLVSNDRLVIGYASGRSESDCLDLLTSVGIHIYKKMTPRSMEFEVKSHLNDNIAILPCKPRDIKTLLSQGIIHAAVCYSNSDTKVSRVGISGAICTRCENIETCGGRAH